MGVKEKKQQLKEKAVEVVKATNGKKPLQMMISEADHRAISDAAWEARQSMTQWVLETCLARIDKDEND